MTGQMKYLLLISKFVKMIAERMVKTQAPTKPSTVFFGDSLMSWVRPTVIPTMYAKISFVMTRAAGRKNQIIPSKTLFMTKCA